MSKLNEILLVILLSLFTGIVGGIIALGLI